MESKDHKDKSHNRKPTKTRSYQDTICTYCQNTGIESKESSHRNVTDIGEIPKAVTTKHSGFKHHCNNCKHKWDTSDKIPYTPDY